MASYDEVEVGGIFRNGKTALPLLVTLNEISFYQPPTPIKNYNSAAEVILTATVRNKFQGNGNETVLYE